MAKEIRYGEDAQKSAVDALHEISSIVNKTLGPGGRTVLVSRNNSANQISVSHTKDGFNVLNSLQYSEPIRDSVHKLALQASGNSVVASGDGSTSSLVMADAFAGALYCSNNPQQSARIFRKEVEQAIEAIKQEAVSTEEAFKKVALTSTNFDEELTETVLEALEGASAYGTVIVEKDPTQKERYKIDSEYGYQSGQGYAYYMPIAQSINETIANQGEFVLRDCYVVPYNGDILKYSQISSIIRKISEKVGESFKLLITAYEISEEVAASIAYMNRANKKVKIFLSNTTRTAEINGAFHQLNDIAAFSGAQVVDGASEKHWEFEDIGKVGLVRVGPHKTFLLQPNEENWIEQRAEQNKEAADVAPSQMDKDIINSRNSSLTGGCVKMIVGGGLFGDLPERADRAEDAIKATQAAMRSGALPGCGASYVRAGQISNVSESVRKALASIHEKIMENYGVPAKTQFEKGETVSIGLEGINESVDFVESGVADSFETVEAVIRNGFELGLLVGNLGGYALEADLDEIEKFERTKEAMRTIGQ